MRNQMIGWLTDDILPQVRQGAAPEKVLLKFANAKNLSAGLLEGLGQLYNTAKTLSYLEKSAHRGGTFPIIDVPELVKDYLVVHTKAATAAPVLREASDLTEIFAEHFAPACLPETLEKSAAAPETGPSLWQQKESAAVHLDFVKQACFEAQEDVLGHQQRVHQMLRRHTLDTDFEQVEKDALFARGERMRPVLEKLASFLTQARWPIKRAADAGPNRLVRDPHGFLPQLDRLQDALLLLETAEEMHKEAANVMDALVTETRHTKPKAAPPKSDAPSHKGGRGGASTQADKTQSPAGGSPPNAGKKPEPKGEGSFFGGVNRTADSLARPLLQRYSDMGQKAFAGINNQGQRHVDHTMEDTRHLAVLQQLLSTDEVLAEADHEKVVDMYNTLRQNAPSLAGDANVARVILRSMVQHDGVSPFDLKGFLDTEQAAQKVNITNRHLDSHLYRGGPLPGAKV